MVSESKNTVGSAIAAAIPRASRASAARIRVHVPAPSSASNASLRACRCEPRRRSAPNAGAIAHTVVAANSANMRTSGTSSMRSARSPIHVPGPTESHIAAKRSQGGKINGTKIDAIAMVRGAESRSRRAMRAAPHTRLVAVHEAASAQPILRTSKANAPLGASGAAMSDVLERLEAPPPNASPKSASTPSETAGKTASTTAIKVARNAASRLGRSHRFMSLCDRVCAPRLGIDQAFSEPRSSNVRARAAT